MLWLCRKVQAAQTELSARGKEPSLKIFVRTSLKGSILKQNMIQAQKESQNL